LPAFPADLNSSEPKADGVSLNSVVDVVQHQATGSSIDIASHPDTESEILLKNIEISAKNTCNIRVLEQH
jgi:hypothetical protein